MKVKVEILPWLSTSLKPGTMGRIRFEHALAGVTFRDLMEELSEADSDFARLIYDRESRELRYPVVVAVNDQLLEFMRGLETPLSEGDDVALMAAYVGG